MGLRTARDELDDRVRRRTVASRQIRAVEVSGRLKGGIRALRSPIQCAAEVGRIALRWRPSSLPGRRVRAALLGPDRSSGAIAHGEVRVTWTECLLVGVLLFGLAGTGGVLLLLAGLIRLIRSDEGLWEGLDLTLVAFAATAAALAGVASCA